ncbi:MAG TPA: hypothetical protein VJ256_05330, partial [Dehalococcoidia bacterium]|nr:hypothetical protein [Dehalococcoidia bacterium]
EAGVPLHQAVERITHIHGLAVDPFNPELLWASSHNGLLTYSPSQGWVAITGGMFDLMGLNLHPKQKGVIYASGHPGIRGRNTYPDRNPLGLQVSRDGGQSWTSRSLVGEGDLHILAVSPAAPSLLYAFNGAGPVVLRSLDEGRTWEVLEAASRLRFLGEGHGLAPHPTERSTVLAATGEGLRISNDAGFSWRPVEGQLANIPVTAVAYHPKNPQLLFAYAPPPGQGLLRSEDGGRTWSPLGLTQEREVVLYIAPHPEDPARLYVATTGLDVLYSQDGGRFWKPLMKEGRDATAG